MTTVTDGVGVMKDEEENVLNSISEKEEVDGTSETNNTHSWLDNNFIETILRHDDGNDQLSVLHIDVKSAVPKGDNYASLLLRVEVEYRNWPNDKETKNRSLIVKSFPEGSEIMEKLIEQTGTFRREGQMYDVTLPAIYKLMKERTGVDHEHLGTRVYVCNRPDTIVLEDLKPLGYKMADRRQGLDLKHSVMALRTLAKFHAVSVALHADDPASMDAYCEGMYSEDNRKMLNDFMVPMFVNLATEVKSWPGFERFEDNLMKISLESVDRTIKMVNKKSDSITVLNHGDFWTNNMMFRCDDEGNVEDVKMLDFQMVRFASPALDIIYFFHTSPSQQVLEDHWDEMLEEYHAALCDAMRLVNCDDDRFISMEQLKQEMEDKAFFAVIVSCMFCIMVAEPEDAPDFSHITEVDMESGTVDVMNKAFAGKRFRAAFQRRLQKFERQGLI